MKKNIYISILLIVIIIFISALLFFWNKNKNLFSITGVLEYSPGNGLCAHYYISKEELYHIKTNDKINLDIYVNRNVKITGSKSPGSGMEKCYSDYIVSVDDIEIIE